MGEFAAERARALGCAGRRLEEALAEYRRVRVEAGQDAGAALTRVRDAAWALVVQRECAGFRARDLTWLRERWQVPDEVLRLI